MTIALVQKEPSGTTTPTQTNASSLSISFDAEPSVGNFIAALISCFENVTVSVADNRGSGAYQLGESHEVITASSGRGFIFYREGMTVTGTPFTVTFTLSGSAFMAAGIAEFSGAARSGAFGGSNESRDLAGGSPMSSGAVNPSRASLYLGLATVDAAGGADNWTLSWSGATTLWLEPSNTTMTHASAYKIGSGSEAAQWTHTGADDWAAIIVAFLDDNVPVVRRNKSPRPIDIQNLNAEEDDGRFNDLDVRNWWRAMVLA